LTIGQTVEQLTYHFTSRGRGGADDR